MSDILNDFKTAIAEVGGGKALPSSAALPKIANFSSSLSLPATLPAPAVVPPAPVQQSIQSSATSLRPFSLPAPPANQSSATSLRSSSLPTPQSLATPLRPLPPRPLQPARPTFVQPTAPIRPAQPALVRPPSQQAASNRPVPPPIQAQPQSVRLPSKQAPSSQPRAVQRPVVDVSTGLDDDNHSRSRSRASSSSRSRDPSHDNDRENDNNHDRKREKSSSSSVESRHEKTSTKKKIDWKKTGVFIAIGVGLAIVIAIAITTVIVIKNKKKKAAAAEAAAKANMGTAKGGAAKNGHPILNQPSRLPSEDDLEFEVAPESSETTDKKHSSDYLKSLKESAEHAQQNKAHTSALNRTLASSSARPVAAVLAAPGSRLSVAERAEIAKTNSKDPNFIALEHAFGRPNSVPSATISSAAAVTPKKD